MPKATTNRPGSQSEAAQSATLLDNQNENFEAVIKANEALASGVAALGQEVLGFASKRVSETIHHSESLAQCKDPNEAFELNYDFAQKATQQYLEEANRLFSLTSDISRQCWAPLEERTRKAVDEANGG